MANFINFQRLVILQSFTAPQKRISQTDDLISTAEILFQEVPDLLKNILQLWVMYQRYSFRGFIVAMMLGRRQNESVLVNQFLLKVEIVKCFNGVRQCWAQALFYNFAPKWKSKDLKTSEVAKPCELCYLKWGDRKAQEWRENRVSAKAFNIFLKQREDPFC